MQGNCSAANSAAVAAEEAAVVAAAATMASPFDAEATGCEIRFKLDAAFEVEWSWYAGDVGSEEHACADCFVLDGCRFGTMSELAGSRPDSGQDISGRVLGTALSL